MQKIVIEIPDTEEIPMNAEPLEKVFEDIKAELHTVTSDIFLSDEWIDKIIDKHIGGKENR